MTLTGSAFTTDILQTIADALEQSQRVLVVSHIDPDGDAIGTLLACRRYLLDLGKDVTAGRHGVIPDKYRFLKGTEDLPLFSEMNPRASFDTVLSLECPLQDRMGDAARFLKNAQKVVNIDHHRDNILYGDINWVKADSSSVGEMITQFFEYKNYTIPTESAEQLYAAVMTDTGRFRFPSTSAETMRVVSVLIAAGANPERISNKVYFEMPISTVRLTGKVLNEIEYLDDGRYCLLTMTREMLKETEAHESEAEGLVDYTLYGRGVRAGVLFKEIDTSTTKASFRSRDGIDVAEIASRFGGGGHQLAAGCTIELPIDEAKKQVVDFLREADRGQEDK
ncbi:MAG TPA: bifunctional oligoribonuclease/PAP phosphatase NrnA [candidate division Zixibacteria bacterium]|nr:bifunctional oligoribonuclease/PAP phosphatase NrnA [candidate division Zixibacteria bacterium]